MAARTAQRKTSMRKSPAKKATVRAKAPKSFLHKMLTAEGWKRLMMGKSSKK